VPPTLLRPTPWSIVRRHDMGTHESRLVEGSVQSLDTELREPARGVLPARRALHHLLGPVNGRRFAVDYWGEFLEPPEPAAARAFTLAIRSAAALRRMLLPPSEYKLAAAYARRDLDVDAGLDAALELGETFRDRLASPDAFVAALPHLMRLPSRAIGAGRPASRLRPMLARRHSRARDAAAVRSHYDVGNEFYGLWLDRELTYSCAYFPTGDEDLDAAQAAKLDHVCRKLRLRPGETLLDVGCGWERCCATRPDTSACKRSASR